MEYIKPNFYESVKAYLHMNYDERMQHNELLFSQAQTKEELINLYYLFENCGVYRYQERLLIRIMALAQTQDDWEFLKFHGMYYHGIYHSAINALSQKESVSWLFFLFEVIILDLNLTNNLNLTNYTMDKYQSNMFS